MNNLDIYNAARTVPQEAIKPIQAGRLKGMSDVNPMWRIKILTELFGACGFGWKYEITRQWIEPGANGEMSAFCNINLYVKDDEQWSEPIPGTGGSSFVANERSGAHTSDECFKMALTDAISVACKALGVAADVYWNSDRTKYSQSGQDSSGQAQQPQQIQYVCCDCGKPFKEFVKNGKKFTAEMLFDYSKQQNIDAKARCSDCMTKAGTKK